MSAYQSFVDTLQEIRGVRTGISGSRIKKLTQIAVDNTDLSCQIVDKLYDNIRDVPKTHKLGALYVIDSIARRYHEILGQRGETPSPYAPEGSLAKAMFKFDQIVEECLRIVATQCSAEQKEKLGKLIDIWRKTGVFTDSKLAAIKNEYFGGNLPTASAPAPPAQGNDATARTAQQLLQSLTSQVQPQQHQQQQPQQPPMPDPAALAEAMKLLASGQLPMGMPGMPQPPSMGQPYQQSPPHQAPQPYEQPRSNPRERFGGASSMSQEEMFRQATGSTGSSASSHRERGHNGFGRRPRSRSPPRNRQRREPPPPGHVPGEKNIPGTAHYRERNVQLDPNLPDNSIKVLSRTMFVGGIPSFMSQDELKAILRPYAEVQSVIMNPERKHAFVKAYSRREAEAVLANYSKITSANLRVRWGVGYGPRDCCDYTHGISIIPIDRLTDADRRWVHTAEWGGIGPDRPLAPNLVMEEPDIEIGEGVSSKAISKKMPTDASRNGPRSSKPGEPVELNNPVANAPFMQNSNNNILSNLFNNAQTSNPPIGGQSPTPTPAAAPAAAAAPVPDALSNLMAMLNKQNQ